MGDKIVYVLNKSELGEIKTLTDTEARKYTPDDLEELIYSANSIDAAFTAEEISAFYTEIKTDDMPKMAKRPKPKKPAAELLYKAIGDFLKRKAEAPAPEQTQTSSKKSTGTRGTGNVAKIHSICDDIRVKTDAMPASKDVVAEAAKQDIPAATAKTQYYVWKKNNK